MNQEAVAATAMPGGGPGDVRAGVSTSVRAGAGDVRFHATRVAYSEGLSPSQAAS